MKEEIIISLVKKIVFSFSAVFVFLGTSCASVSVENSANLAPDFMEKLVAEDRPEEDSMRDGSRRPYQVMNTLGVGAGMTVMDIGAGGGWYTRVLSAAVGPQGKVIAQFGPRALQRENGSAPRALASSLGNTEALFENVADQYHTFFFVFNNFKKTKIFDDANAVHAAVRENKQFPKSR